MPKNDEAPSASYPGYFEEGSEPGPFSIMQATYLPESKLNNCSLYPANQGSKTFSFISLLPIDPVPNSMTNYTSSSATHGSNLNSDGCRITLSPCRNANTNWYANFSGVASFKPISSQLSQHSFWQLFGTQCSTGAKFLVAAPVLIIRFAVRWLTSFGGNV